MQADDPPIVVEQEYISPVGRLWEAITDPTQMKQWFFAEMKDFEPTVGFETKFQIEFDGKVYAHVWKVIVVDPGKKIVYDWSYDNCEGRGHVTWDLEETSGGSKLTLTNSIIESFPQDDPAFKRESGEAGWRFFINEELKEFVET